MGDSPRLLPAFKKISFELQGLRTSVSYFLAEK
jgi:hypothetical protein